MAKAKNTEKKPNERPAGYQDKLTVNGSFLDMMKASAKDATAEPAQKTESKA